MQINLVVPKRIELDENTIPSSGMKRIYLARHISDCSGTFTLQECCWHRFETFKCGGGEKKFPFSPGQKVLTKVVK